MSNKELIMELRDYATQLQSSLHIRHMGAVLIERAADALAAVSDTTPSEGKRASTPRENESFCKASPRESWEAHRGHACRGPFSPHKTVVDWALYWWQVSDDEFIPMGEAEDLLAALVLHIEGVEKRAEAAEAKIATIRKLADESWAYGADEFGAFKRDLRAALQESEME